ncbi:hypothetical protein PFISCL1PPCAC_14554 [Pristionchus fissidentatus]|uniref:Uncharacterized protein n=1 Tax=Pristionchus fissidentatus TaxID=1538716 RepID=A0AAV5VU96_9BILA|nr:hypothetical protein PFISCL1PPCAC_14554 [Pristionchus fissidentatus]
MTVDELANIVVVHRNNLYEIRTVNSCKEAWRRSESSDEIRKISLKSNIEIDRLFCMGSAVIINDSVQFHVFDIDSFEHEKIIAFQFAPLLLSEITQDGRVLVYSREVDSDVKAVKSITFQTSTLPVTIVNLLKNGTESAHVETEQQKK